MLHDKRLNPRVRFWFCLTKRFQVTCRLLLISSALPTTINYLIISISSQFFNNSTLPIVQSSDKEAIRLVQQSPIQVFIEIEKYEK